MEKIDYKGYIYRCPLNANRDNYVNLKFCRDMKKLEILVCLPCGVPKLMRQLIRKKELDEK